MAVAISECSPASGFSSGSDKPKKKFSETFLSVPNTIARLRLPGGCKLTFGRMVQYAGYDDALGEWVCFSGVERLAGETGQHPATIKRHTKRLSEKGLISIIRRGQGRTNLYVIPSSIFLKNDKKQNATSRSRTLHPPLIKDEKNQTEKKQTTENPPVSDVTDNNPESHSCCSSLPLKKDIDDIFDIVPGNHQSEFLKKQLKKLSENHEIGELRKSVEYVRDQKGVENFIGYVRKCLLNYESWGLELYIPKSEQPPPDRTISEIQQERREAEDKKIFEQQQVEIEMFNAWKSSASESEISEMVEDFRASGRNRIANRSVELVDTLGFRYFVLGRISA